MPKTIDPLLLLREHIQQNKKITKQGNHLIFEDNIKLRSDTPTACIQSQTKKQYTLGSLWLYLKHRTDPLTVYIKESQKEGVDLVKGLDKDKINDFFIQNIDNLEIIDQEVRPKTLIFLGKKKPGDNYERVLDEESMNKETKEEERKNENKAKPIPHPNQIKKFRTEDLEPNLRVMNFIYTREKKSLNRNSILRPSMNLTSYENLLNLCKSTFIYNKIENKQNESLSFLDELISSDDLKGNKAIIVVPSTFYPGNLSMDNAEQFLVDAG